MYTVNVEAFANELISSIKEYRKARDEANSGKIVSGIDGYKKYERELEDYLKEKQNIYAGEMVNLPRSEYWKNVIKAKAEVIAAIGGCALLVDVCDQLSNHPENAVYHFASAFEVAADGLAGFYI
ncbi:hypothetical protein V6C27_03030 [Peptococcaceae bacterium 1198_IL3148]